MALNAGTRLGPYEITALLGVGGMGEVYRATDTNLKRQVAIKVLPASLASDAERLARFQREAEILAALNHPNIAHIHGLEKSDGTIALAMELVEGPTLAERIAKGPIPLDEALPIAKQIAEAVEAAHEQGIIHRDLKPANIKVRPDGTVKVLDFGLAKALDPLASSPNVSQSPTITTPAMTQAGMIVGTAAYMSPEQARGKPIDRRADIWAFGCVLYEMLTGLRAFGGEDVTDTLAAIVRGQPEWSRLPPDVPAAVTRLLKRCLEKDIILRLQHLGDARLDLIDAISTKGPSSSTGPAGVTRRRAWSLATATLLLGSLTTGGIIWSFRPAPNTSRDVSYLSINVDPLAGLGGTATVLRSADLTADLPILSRTAFALSPDGRRLVFVGEHNGDQRLFVRTLQEPEAKPIAGTEGALNPFFSPDGLAVGFWANGQLKKVAIAGGPSTPICEVPLIFGASWAAGGRIVFAEETGPLKVVSENGGHAEPLTSVEPGINHRLPWVLPGGEVVLFTSVSTGVGSVRRWEEAKVLVRSLRTGEQHVLVEGAASPAYMSSGHLLYLKLGVLWAAPFDRSTLQVTGPAAPIIDGVLQSAGIATNSIDTGAGQYAISETGTIVYLPGHLLLPDLKTIVWTDRNGRTEASGFKPGQYFQVRISPDGQRVVVADQSPSNVLVLDRRSGVTQRLPNPGFNVSAWTPDGSRIFYGWAHSGSRNVFWQRADGGGSAEQLSSSQNSQLPGPALADGSAILMVQNQGSTSSTHADIFRLDLNPPRHATPLLQERFSQAYPDLSADNRWLAYASDESGSWEVYVRSYPTLDQKRLISNGGGYMPAWSRDGHELYYMRGASQASDQDIIMAVDADTRSGLQTGTPHELFRGYFVFSNNTRTYDVAKDGRFLMVARGASNEQRSSSLRIVLNWSEELRQRMATK